MKIEFSAKDNPHKWIEALAARFGAEIKDNAFNIPPQTGKGFLKQFYFFEGFTLSYIHFHFFKTMKLIRQATSEAQLIPIMFFTEDAAWEQTIDQQKRNMGYHSPDGIFMPSPQIPSEWIVHPGVDGFQITLTIDKNWLQKTLGNTETIYINRLTQSGAPFYLFESLTTVMMQTINTINCVINSEDKLKELRLHQECIKLFNLFLEKIEKRAVMPHAVSLNSSDVESVFKIRKILLKNLTDTPPIIQLAMQAGMSISKLQKCFQQVFGSSISQYALSEKMNLARQMLDSKKYSVSEVGYQTGYSNLSHFSKAFKKEFGINPKTYLSSL